eukprot:CAMPEP_0177580568 /NCGR_PEP_ID=MMETSP0419_2-20121207/1633_1 /TAXON_ID=582737 /ORGANISM="Tetraselmis sp., Strain GSL018" /LENGTH=412 /DNA_ID=CAMNT_0019069451 /DNA_START=389 /DNA_END=1628 /DNA_ORIENTATION=-
MNLTIPCLLFSTVVDCDQNHSPAPCPRVEANIRNGWPLLLLPVVNVSVGLLIGFFNTCLFKPPQDFRRAATAAVAFGNSTGMPITLLSVIYNTLSSRAPLGSVDPVFYLSVYLLVYPVLTWGIGGVLMGIGSTDQPANDGPPSRLEHYAPGSDTGSLEAPLLERDPERGGKWCLDVSSLQAVMVRVRGFVSATFQPPVVASLIGMLIAVTPARGIFVDVVTRNGDAPLQFLTDGIMRIGQAAVPINMLILGASLSKGADWTTVPWSLNLSIAVSKLCVMPVVGVSMAFLLKAFLPEGTQVDAGFYLVVMIVTCTPTANNLMVMAELGSQNKHALGTCIFTQYMLSPLFLALSVWMAITIAMSHNLVHPAARAGFSDASMSPQTAAPANSMVLGSHSATPSSRDGAHPRLKEH